MGFTSQGLTPSSKIEEEVLDPHPPAEAEVDSHAPVPKTLQVAMGVYAPGARRPGGDAHTVL